MITPWNETFPIYCYHKARFAMQYLTEKYAVIQTAQDDFCERLNDIYDDDRDDDDDI